MPLDPLSPVPRYQQIAEIIRARIEAGELREGDSIPSRQQIQDEYEVARDTAAKALRALVDDGLVVVVPGMGAKVARRKGLARMRGDRRFSTPETIVRVLRVSLP